MTDARLGMLLAFAWGTVATALVLAPPVGNTETAVPAAPTGDPIALAIATLRETDRFASFAVGAGGITSTQALAWRVIMQSSSADSGFKVLLATASRPGQLYALAALFLTDKPAYERGAAYQRALGGKVATQFGCIGSQQPVAIILEGMDQGKWTSEFLVGRSRPLTGFRS